MDRTIRRMCGGSQALDSLRGRNTMTRWTIRALYMLTLTSVGVATAAAQQAVGQVGTVAGQVIAVGSREPVQGAQLLVVGTMLRAAAGADGRFVIRNVPAGSQTIRAQLLGFSPKEQVVTVTAGGTTAANFEMKDIPYAVAPVVVTALGIARE